MSVLELAKRERLPCCTFVALALLENEGHEINEIADGPKAAGSSWWSQANVWSLEQPWSALRAAESMSGATSIRVRFVKDVAPPLRAGRWHVVQRWKGLDHGDEPWPGDDQVVPGRSSGHTYLAHMDERGRVRIVQSSEAQGYRDTDETDPEGWPTWSGAAGLSGYSVGVCYLPKGWQWVGSSSSRSE